MTAWSSRSMVACLFLLSACPGEPPPEVETSTGPEGTSTGVGPGTTPQPTTVDPDTSSSGVDTTASTSIGPDDTTGSTSSTGPDDTTGSTDTGTDTGTTDTGTTDTGTTDTSTTDTGTTDTGTTTAGDPCDAGDGPDFTVTNSGLADYVINGLNDPPLTVVRGCSYTFNVNAAGHPFLIKSVQGTGLGNTYNDGVVGNGTQSGLITWNVPMAAPGALFYNCQFHAPMTGTITVIDP